MQSDFIQKSVLSMEQIPFERLKSSLLGEYIRFRVIDYDDVTKEILAEKLHDYFDKVEYRTGKKFGDLVKNYVSELDSLVEPHIAKAPATKKNEPEPTVPRARRFYEKAVEIKNNRKDFAALIDYSRIMLCLYTAIINSGHETITNLDFALSCLKFDMVEAALKKEKENVLLGMLNQKPRFNISDPYTVDGVFFVFLIIIFYTIIGISVGEDINNE